VKCNNNCYENNHHLKTNKEQLTVLYFGVELCISIKAKQSKAKKRCVMGVGMCLYAQLVQTKNK